MSTSDDTGTGRHEPPAAARYRTRTGLYGEILKQPLLTVPELTEDEKAEAARRYILARYARITSAVHMTAPRQGEETGEQA